MEGTITCSGDQPMAGTMRLQAASPTSFAGRFQSTGTASGDQVSMTADMTAKFVSATCPKE